MTRCLLLLLVACGSDAKPEQRSDPKPEAPKPDPNPDPKTKPEAPKPEAPKASSQPGLTVTLDGKPIAIQSIVAVDSGEGQIEIRFRNYVYTCKEFTDGSSSRSSEPTDFDFDLRAGKYLHEEGGVGWAIRGKYLFGRYEGGTTTSQQEKEYGGDPFPPATVLDPGAGKTSDLPFDFEMKTTASDKSPARTLVVKGTAKVSGCGNSKFKKDVTLEPQPGATIEIAGQSLPIVGAGYIEKRDGNRELTIATHPVKCVEGSDYTTTRSDVAIELAWTKAGKLYAVERQGYWVDWAVNQSDPALTATPNRAPGGAKELAINLGGTTTVQGYPVALKGKVKAIVCPTPK